MNKKGDISLSFNMIFSIIIIISILGIAFYTISYFMNLSRCTQVSLFYEDFQDRIDAAWNSQITSDQFSAKLPSGIESACFGDLNSPGLAANTKEYNDLKIYAVYEANMFLYPSSKTCDIPYKKIEHVDISELGGFTCIPLVDNTFKIDLEKGAQDALVRIIR